MMTATEQQDRKPRGGRAQQCTGASQSAPRAAHQRFLTVFPGTVTPTAPTPGPADSVHFLGLELPSHSAEVALYVLFALSAAGVLGLALFAYKYGKLSKRSRKRTHTQLSKL